MRKIIIALLLMISLSFYIISEDSILGKWVVEYVSDGGPHIYETYDFKKNNTLVYTYVSFAANIFKGEPSDYKNCMDEKKEFLMSYKIENNALYVLEGSDMAQNGNLLFIECKEDNSFFDNNNIINKTVIYSFNYNNLNLITGTNETIVLKRFQNEIDSMKRIFIESNEGLIRVSDFLKFNIDKNLIGEWSLFEEIPDQEYNFPFKNLYFDKNGFLMLDYDMSVYNIKSKELIFSNYNINEVLKQKSYKFKINKNVLEIILNDGGSIKLKKAN